MASRAMLTMVESATAINEARHNTASARRLRGVAGSFSMALIYPDEPRDILRQYGRT